MERHKCKLCSRTFSTGRALGGHMKSHLASLPLPSKKTHHQLGDTNESASSSSSSSGEEQEPRDKSSEVAEEKSLAYGLRNNPKKSFRLADPEFSFAVDSGSVVQDRESETESRNPTRRRSKRAWKLCTTTDQDQKQQNLEIKKPKLSNFLDAPTEPEQVSSVFDAFPEEDVAMCLMKLSTDVWTRNNREKVQENCKERERSIEMEEESKKIKVIRGKHCCEKCKKVFRSSHALSGHKKVCEAETKNARGKVCTDEKIFECPFCYKVFGSGQALGGHKRSHLLASSSTASTVHSVSVKVENNLIDLNLPAPLEEDAYSVVSDA